MTLRRACLIVTILSAIVSALILTAGINHNMQCEFYCDGRFDWAYAAQSFVLVFLIFAVPLNIACVAGFFVLRRTKRGGGS